MSEYNPVHSTVNDVSSLLHVTNIFIEIFFWTQIRNKNSTTREPKANLITVEKFAVREGNKMLNGKMHFCACKYFVFSILYTSCFDQLLLTTDSAYFTNISSFIVTGIEHLFLIKENMLYVKQHAQQLTFVLCFFVVAEMQQKHKSGTKVKREKKGMRRTRTTPIASSFGLSSAFTLLLPSNLEREKKTCYTGYTFISSNLGDLIENNLKCFYHARNCSIACVAKLWTQSASLSFPWICICL